MCLRDREVEYCGERRKVNVVALESEEAVEAALGPDVLLVRSSARLMAWIDQWRCLGQPEFGADDSLGRDLVAALGDHLAHFEPDAALGSWTTTSVIHRDTATPGKGPATTAHRDLDETAVANLKDVAAAFVNAWIPLMPVNCDPIALVDPATVTPTQATSYRNYNPADTTGLRSPIDGEQDHRWVWVPGLGPGDALCWRSDVVFHASFRLPHQNAGHRTSAESRRSIDARFQLEAD